MPAQVIGLTQTDINILNHYQKVGDRVGYWNYLSSRPGNDGYGALALAVARNDNRSGQIANQFAQDAAARAGVSMDAREWEKFGIDLMRRDLAE